MDLAQFRPFTRFMAFVLAVGAFTTIETSPARAQTCAVPADIPLIQMAIDDPSCAEIEVESGSYTGNFSVNREVTIRGAGIGQTILSPALALSPVIDVMTEGELRLDDVTIDGDPQGVGAFAQHGIATRNRLVVNRIEVMGFSTGVIDNPNEDRTRHTQLFSCAIHSNGRGIDVQHSPLLMQACEVRLNAPNGGMVMGQGNILSSLIELNANTGDGGGIFVINGGRIDRTEIIGNTAAGLADDNADGGGVFLLGDLNTPTFPANVVLTIEDSLIEGNVANGFGGGVAVHRYAEVVLPPPGSRGDNPRRSPNPGTGMSGSGALVLDHYLGNLLMRDTIVRGNTSYHVGGGVSVRGIARIEDSVIENNQALRDPSIFLNGLGSGGGVGIHLGEADIERTAIIGNSTSTSDTTGLTGDGGGIVVGIGSSGELMLKNSSIAENRAENHGGGIHNQDLARIDNATIARNIADHDGDDAGDGGGLSGPGYYLMTSSILFENEDHSPTSIKNDCDDAIESYGSNIGPDVIDCTFINVTTPLVPDILLDPSRKHSVIYRVAPYEDTIVVVIEGDSPAADQGNCDAIAPADPDDWAVDQRGLPRIKQDGNGDGGADGDGCDIGAFEIQTR